MKNKFLIVTFFSAFLLVTSNVKAANFTDYQTVDANKTWTIKFTGDVGIDNGKIQGITVTDSKDNPVNVGVQLGEDNKTVIVTTPTGGYTAGESYILNVGSKAHSSDGKALKNEYKVHFNIKSSDKVVTFKDKNLEHVIRQQINKPTGDIYKSDVEGITMVNDVCHSGIQDISGIENLTNLQYLYLPYNQISDINALKGLTNLKNLDLRYSQISDISVLKGLTNLQSLDLDGNPISDISVLGGLTNLKSLGLYKNKINNVNPLKNLTNLYFLSLPDNQISDISELQGLTNLKYLYLNNNQISDISSLGKLTNLQVLGLSSNKISNVNSLNNLSNLNTLYLGDNQISDADKQSLKSVLPKCNINF